MNIKDTLGKANEEKEIEKTKEEIPIEDLKLIATKIKAGTTIEELDKRSEILIKLLTQFSNKIPVMIKRLEVINEGLSLEALVELKENSDKIIKLGKEFLNYDRSIIENNQKIYKQQIEEISIAAKNSINKKGIFYYLLDKTFIGIILTLLILNIFMGLYYKNKSEKINYEISKLHDILMEDSKYWLDKENHNLYIKYNKNKN